MKKITLWLLAMFCFNFSWHANAQLISDNNCTVAFEDISATGIELVLTDDGEENIVLPFEFTLDGISSSDLRVGNNGGVLFNATSGDVAISSTPSAQGFYPFADDIDSDYGTVVWEVLGTAPNRRAVIMWNDRPHYSNSTSGATFELILHETSNEITFLYQDTDFGNSAFNDGISAGILVVGANGAYVYSTDTALGGVTCINWTTPSCAFPNNLSATDITVNSAVLNWVELGTASLYNIEVVEAGVTPTGIATDSGVANGFEKTGLTPNTVYEFYVQADCTGGDVSAWVGPYSFTTACSATDSFNENFDLVSTPNLPTCWSSLIDNGASSSATVGTSTSADNTEPNGVSLYNSSSTSETNIMLVSPVLSNLGAGTHQLRFFARNSSSTQDIEVGTIADPSDGSTFTVLETIDLTTTFDEYVVYFDEYVGTDTYIAIRRLSTSTYTYVYIDDMIWEPIPSCISVSDLSVSGITSTSANLSWMENGDASIYNVEVVEAGVTPSGTPTNVGVENPFSLVDLNPATTYEFYVQADCTGGDTSSWEGPFSFTTECAPIVPEYNANMAVNPADTCWEEANNGDLVSGPTELGSGTWYASNHNGTPSNAINLYFNSKSDWIISPEFDLSTSGPSELNVYVALTESSTSGAGASLGSDDMVVLLMTIDGGTTWTTLQTWGQGTEPSDVGELINFDLSAQSGIVQFAFWASEGAVNDPEDIYFHVSKFQVREIPSCTEPSGLSVSNVTFESVVLSWSENGDTWDIEWGLSGFTPTGVPNINDVNDNPYNLMNLESSTAYDYYVRTDCGMDDSDVSEWVGPMSFYTGYCLPTGTSTSTYINSFSTSLGTNNISNIGSGMSTDNYGDFSNMEVSLGTSQSFDFNVEIVSGTVGCAIWIDWNGDLLFDESEVQYSTTSYGNGPFTGSITIPEATADGSYRMRVLIDWNDSNPGNDDACSFGSGRGEIEDYTVTVDSALSINDNNLEHTLSYFPNPVEDKLAIRSQYKIETITVVNMLGQEVIKMSPNSMSSNVEMSQLQSGAYFVKVTIESKTEIIRVIKR